MAVATSAAPVSTALTLIDPGAAHVTPSRGNAYADPFPLHPCLPFAPFQPADLHRPRWRLPALSAIYPRVFTAVHNPSTRRANSLLGCILKLCLPASQVWKSGVI